MIFTELHRQLGLEPAPLTDEMIDAAIDAGVVESDALDWKSAFPSGKLPQSDFPKDVAAMANSGGGVIVYGVKESGKAATGRVHVDCDENLERSLHSAAVTAISPPVFGLKVVRLGADPQAAVVIVPNSVDGPHLIYKGEYFGAPLRNDADTVWMKEREVAAAYRARFDEQRWSSEALESLYEEALAGRDVDQRAWFIAVARPRVPGIGARPSREQAKSVFVRTESIVFGFSTQGDHPLNGIEWTNPRPGLRRWTALTPARGDSPRWDEAWASVHHDGAVSLAAAAGGHWKLGTGDKHGKGEVMGSTVEAMVADVAGLMRANAEALGHDEYEMLVGIEWAGDGPLRLLTVDTLGGFYDGVSTPVRQFTPTRSTIDASASDDEFHRRVYELAQDCVNQGGLTTLRVITEPPAIE